MRARFERIFGQATELDAFAHFHPDEFERILSDALSEYSNVTIDDWGREQYRRYINDLYEKEQDVLGAYESELENLQEKRERLEQTFAPLIKAINAAKATHQVSIDELTKLYRQVHSQIKRDLENVDIDLDDYTDGLEDAIEDSLIPEDDNHWLFDSSRDYLEQIGCYRDYENNRGYR